jgi:hypothetical protein
MMLVAFAACIAATGAVPAPAAAAKHEPQWLRALEIRSDALNRKYHLGRYAHIPPAHPAAEFDWSAAAVGSGSTVAALAALGAVALTVRASGGRSRLTRPAGGTGSQT